MHALYVLCSLLYCSVLGQLNIVSVFIVICNSSKKETVLWNYSSAWNFYVF